MTLELMQEPKVKVEDMTALDAKLRAKLGYDGLYFHGKNTKLLCELIAAGHVPFSETAVDKYKRAQVRNAWFKIHRPSMIMLALVPFAIFGACSTGDSTLVTVLCIIAAFALVMGSIIRAVNFAADTTVTWQIADLRGYGRPIPFNVLQKALAIAETFPGVKMYIDELRVEKRPVDPFLFVKGDNDTRYYVAVWNEPTFEDAQVE